MKKHLFLTILLSIITCCSFAQSSKELIHKINQLSQRIDSAFHSGNIEVYSKIIPNLNKELINRLVSFANQTPGFMQNGFCDKTDSDSLKHSIYTITSEDNKLKIVSWQDGGGTLGSYQYIVFWQVGNKIRHKITSDNTPLAFDSEVSTVHHIRRTNGNNLYFCISEGGERNNYGMSIQCLEIDKAGNLNTNIPVFKAGTKMLSKINIRNFNDYSYSNVSSSSKANEIRFGADGKTLYIPIILNNWKRSDDDQHAIYVLHHFVYQFDGTNFVYKKKI